MPTGKQERNAPMNDINATFSLRDFATTCASLADNTRVRIVMNNGNGTLDTKEEDVGVNARTFKTVAGTEQALENNFVRTKLMETLNRHYDGKIPAEVRRALVGSSLRGAHDMDGWSKQGDTVTSGRPLTARRIRAVMTAVENYDATHVESEVNERDAQLRAALAELKATKPFTLDMGTHADGSVIWRGNGSTDRRNDGADDSEFIVKLHAQGSPYDKEDAPGQFESLMNECDFKSLYSSDTQEKEPEKLGTKITVVMRGVTFSLDDEALSRLPKLFSIFVKIATHRNPEVVRLAAREAGDYGYLMNGLHNVLHDGLADKTVMQKEIKKLTTHFSLNTWASLMRCTFKVGEFRAAVADFMKRNGADNADQLKWEDQITYTLLEGLGDAVYGNGWQD